MTEARALFILFARRWFSATSVIFLGGIILIEACVNAHLPGTTLKIIRAPHVSVRGEPAFDDHTLVIHTPRVDLAVFVRSAPSRVEGS
ncbi:hypothetical protein DFH09DRAFT_1169756 [Mycena vulgaris]|nr:hypothetical protein DFH09DRAFT_1169756 [Mycena vulgaris]